MSSLFAYLAAVLLGLLAGAMLLIGVAIVPYWQSLDPLDFSQWFAANAVLIGRLMIPLGSLATISVIAAAVVARGKQSPGWPWLAAATLFALYIAAIYPLYYSSANAALASGALSPEAITADLEQWRLWHWSRVIAAMLAFGCVLVSLGAQRATIGRTSR